MSVIYFLLFLLFYYCNFDIILKSYNTNKNIDGDLMLSVDDETDHGMTLISTAGVDLEIVTEDLAIKMHENIWKNDDKALEEELKMLEAEKAAHMKVFTIIIIIFIIITNINVIILF